MTLDNRYSEILAKVHEKALACGREPADICLVAVTKYSSVESMCAVYEAGSRDFGESRVADALDKIPLFPSDCRWHFIGTLQSNKVAKVVSHFHLIHSVDNPALARKISLASEEKGVITPLLLQVNTSQEATKHGLSAEEWKRELEGVNQLTHIRIEGLMTMAPYTEDEKLIRECFRSLYECREKWRCEMKDPASFQHLSMGMSHDYLIAIEEGATILRIGTAIFKDN